VDEKRIDPKAALQELATESFGDAGPHCGLDLIIYYRQGLLLPVERFTVQEHLSRCAQCTRLLLELRDFEVVSASEDAEAESLRQEVLRSLIQDLPSAGKRRRLRFLSSKEEEFFNFLRRIRPLLRTMLRAYRISEGGAELVLGKWLYWLLANLRQDNDDFLVYRTYWFMREYYMSRYLGYYSRHIPITRVVEGALFNWLYISSEESSVDVTEENAVLKELLLEWWHQNSSEESPEESPVDNTEENIA